MYTKYPAAPSRTTKPATVAAKSAGLWARG